MDNVFILTRTTTYTAEFSGTSVTSRPILVGAYETEHDAANFRDEWERNYPGYDGHGATSVRTWEITQYAPIPF